MHEGCLVAARATHKGECCPGAACVSWGWGWDKTVGEQQETWMGAISDTEDPSTKGKIKVMLRKPSEQKQRRAWLPTSAPFLSRHDLSCV
jgi:Tfp pilus assembly protein FimT